MDVLHAFVRRDTCETGNGYDGKIGARISAIFVILVGSLFGATFPVFAHRHRGLRVPSWVFFIAKYFGSGVIVATAFIHLLAPAADALTDPCLTGPITEYDWAEGIALMTIFVMFFLELMTMRYAKFGQSHDHSHSHEPAVDSVTQQYLDSPAEAKINGDHDHDAAHSHAPAHEHVRNTRTSQEDQDMTHVRGEDHLGHAREHVDVEKLDPDTDTLDQKPSPSGRQIINPESYAAQLTAVFILEFGVIFHSIFIGLTLAVAGDEFSTLYVVLVFHQSFEGLGLGTRLAAVPWPKTKRWTPYLLGVGYALSTPIAIAIGLGVRTTYPPNSARTLIVNGCFDSVSAGILIYTGLVELMAHEFMFSSYMQRASIKTVLSAFTAMCFGAGLMALLGKWA